jgi:hypothetical protein
MSGNQEESKMCSISGEHFKKSMLSEMMKDGLSRLLAIFGQESFTFVVKDRNVKSILAEALLIAVITPQKVIVGFHKPHHACTFVFSEPLWTRR